MSEPSFHEASRAASISAPDAPPGKELLLLQELSKSAYAKLQEQFQRVNQNREVGRFNYLLDPILQRVEEGVLFVSLDGMIVLANPACAFLVSRPLETLRDMKFWDLFTDDYFGFSLREALTFGISHRLIYKSFASKELEISSAFLSEGAKSLHGLLIILRDISERQRNFRTVIQEDRMKELGKMAATVAHEIRNPLGGIRGFASLLYRDLCVQKPLQEMASAIIEGTKTLERLVGSILHFAKPIQIQLQSTDLGAFLKETMKFVKIDPSFPPNMKIALHIPHDLILVPIDAAALRSALLNLLFNAFQSMPEGGILSLSLLKLEGMCQVLVSDTGMGMDSALQQKLFSPFFTTKKGGTGLGLVETRRIVQSHGGTIEVRSVPSKGTTFTITLPLRR
ncbi:MAG: hypothetical protein HY861_00300 [Chlamydiia bacterium]|nr:hypothetical protein [Chlamydiia bacterium]